MSSLDAAVANEVVVVATMPGAVPKLESLAVECEEAAAKLTARHQLQEKAALLLKAEALREEIQRIRDRVYEMRVAELSTKYALNACMASREIELEEEEDALCTAGDDARKDSVSFEPAHLDPTHAQVVKRSTSPPRFAAPPAKRAKPSQKQFVQDFMHESSAKAEARVLVQPTSEVCSCGGQLLVTPSKSLVRCQSCGAASTTLDSVSTSLSFDESYTCASFSYERLNHFLEHVARSQGRGLFTPSDELLEQIMCKLRDDGVDPSELTVATVRKAMKALKISSKTREHAPLIYSRLSGRPLPQLKPSDEERLRLQFLALQPPFAKHIPPSRKNFLSYPVTLHRLLILNGFDELLPSVALLSGKGKNENQDVLLRRIFSDLDWEFNSAPPIKA